MGRGGKRLGAGRKPGLPNKVSRELKELAQQYTEEALEALVRVLRDTKAPASAQVAAATAILDRGYGKPAQHIDGHFSESLEQRLLAMPVAEQEAMLKDLMGKMLDNDPRLGEVVVSEEAIRTRIEQMGKEITADYAHRPPLLVGVLKGAFVFMSDLARAIDLPVEFDFMAVSSYGSATKTSGVVRILKDLELDLTNRNVLIVEDIIDSGLTLSYLRRNLRARNPASVEVCALLVKEGLQTEPADLKYVGFVIPPDFVVGYGLDVAERYRNLPYVATYIGA